MFYTSNLDMVKELCFCHVRVGVVSKELVNKRLLVYLSNQFFINLICPIRAEFPKIIILISMNLSSSY